MILLLYCLNEGDKMKQNFEKTVGVGPVREGARDRKPDPIIVKPVFGVEGTALKPTHG